MRFYACVLELASIFTGIKYGVIKDEAPMLKFILKLECYFEKIIVLKRLT